MSTDDESPDMLDNHEHMRLYADLRKAKFFSFDMAGWEEQTAQEAPVYIAPAGNAAEHVDSPFDHAPAAGMHRPIPDPPPHSSGPEAGDVVSFVADILAIVGAGGLATWGKEIYRWLKRPRNSADAGAILAVALWRLAEEFPNAQIGHRYDVLNPIRDSGSVSPYEAVYIFRFYDQRNGHVYTLECDSRGELRGKINQRTLGAFE
jgi:hypothetical protein